MGVVPDPVLIDSTPFSVPEFIDHSSVTTPKLCYIQTPAATMLPPGTVHRHNSYEFLVPHRNMTIGLASDSGRLLERQLPAGLLFPFNPDQAHGSSELATEFDGHAFVIDRDTIAEAAATMRIRSIADLPSESLPVPTEIRVLTRLFTEEARGRQAGYEFLLELTAMQLTMLLLRVFRPDGDHRRPRVHPGSRDTIARAMEFFQDNLTSQYSLTEVTAAVGMDPFRFIRAFRARTGKTPHEYLADLKLERACHLLVHSKQSVTEICITCGFSDPSHFATTFRRRIGVPPSEYRRLRS